MNDDSHFLMSLSCEMASNGREYYSQRCREIAAEIERLRAAVDIALEALRQIDRKSAEYLVALNSAALNIHKHGEA